jgi:GTP pyrophosphokinase
VTSVDRRGVLADVSAIISKKEANIINAEIKTTMDKKGISYFTVQVESYKQLEEIMGAIKKVENVLIVERV